MQTNKQAKKWSNQHTTTPSSKQSTKPPSKQTKHIKKG
jgi:hypothetical protein